MGAPLENRLRSLISTLTESRQRVLNAIDELKDKLKGRILSVGGPALYRAGDRVPEGTIAVDPGGGDFIIAAE
jgi:hypothetical protein